MYSHPNDPNCPVASLKLYLSKLSLDEEHFFQTPRKSQKESFSDMNIWYKRKMGINTLASMMNTISKSANLSQEYSNHCIRATVCTVLSQNEIDSGNIIKVTRHKDSQSIAPYIATSSNRKRKEMSQILFDCGKGDINQIAPRFL